MIDDRAAGQFNRGERSSDAGRVAQPKSEMADAAKTNYLRFASKTGASRLPRMLHVIGS